MIWYLIYMKYNVYKQMRLSIILERKGAWEERRGRERVALIKSLITIDRKDVLEAWLQKIELKMSADNSVRFKFVQILLGPNNSGPNLTEFKFIIWIGFALGKPNLTQIRPKSGPNSV